MAIAQELLVSILVADILGLEARTYARSILTVTIERLGVKTN